MSRNVRLGILLGPALSCILTAAPAGAQVEIQPEALAYHKACLNDASSSKSVIQTGGRFVYTCWGSVAESYFDYLVSKNAAQTLDRQRTGTYTFRAIPQLGRCWHKTNNADNTSVFGCAISLAKPLS
jgi:hypothetical protein